MAHLLDRLEEVKRQTRKKVQSEIENIIKTALVSKVIGADEETTFQKGMDELIDELLRRRRKAADMEVQEKKDTHSIAPTALPGTSPSSPPPVQRDDERNIRTESRRTSGTKRARPVDDGVSADPVPNSGAIETSNKEAGNSLLNNFVNHYILNFKPKASTPNYVKMMAVTLNKKYDYSSRKLVDVVYDEIGRRACTEKGLVAVDQRERRAACTKFAYSIMNANNFESTTELPKLGA